MKTLAPTLSNNNIKEKDYKNYINNDINIILKSTSHSLQLLVFNTKELKYYSRKLKVSFLANTNLQGLSSLAIMTSVYLCGSLTTINNDKKCNFNNNKEFSNYNINNLHNNLSFINHSFSNLNNFDTINGSILVKIDFKLLKTTMLTLRQDPKSTILMNSFYPHYKPIMLEFKKKYIIIIGGKNSIDCEIFSLVSHHWKKLPKLPESRYNGKGLVVNECNIYVFGGQNELIQNEKTKNKVNKNKNFTDNFKYKNHSTNSSLLDNDIEDIRNRNSLIKIKNQISRSFDYNNIKCDDNDNGFYSVKSNSIDNNIYNRKSSKISDCISKNNKSEFSDFTYSCYSKEKFIEENNDEKAEDLNQITPTINKRNKNNINTNYILLLNLKGISSLKHDKNKWEIIHVKESYNSPLSSFSSILNITNFGIIYLNSSNKVFLLGGYNPITKDINNNIIEIDLDILIFKENKKIRLSERTYFNNNNISSIIVNTDFSTIDMSKLNKDSYYLMDYLGRVFYFNNEFLCKMVSKDIDINDNDEYMQSNSKISQESSSFFDFGFDFFDKMKSKDKNSDNVISCFYIKNNTIISSSNEEKLYIPIIELDEEI